MTGISAGAGGLGPFGRPLFDDPHIRALSQVGVVDIGSNSVRLVIFDGAARSPAYFFNEKVMCGLGDGMGDTGRLNPDGKRRALAAMQRFQTLAAGLGMGPLYAVATAAMREAEDGAEFRAEVLAQTGLEIFIIDGETEARMAAQGVLLGWPKARGVVCDIGGSSMEMSAVDNGQIGRCETSPLGPLRLRGLRGGARARQAQIDDESRRLANIFGDRPERLYLVGGSWRAIAKIDMARRAYPLQVLHEYTMTPGDLRETLALLAKSDPDTLRSQIGVSNQRMALVPEAGEALAGVLRRMQPGEIAVSAYGLREGLLYEQMPETLRNRDPLLEAARFAEMKDARVPGFGKALFRFVRPLFPDAGDDLLRLVRAACLLHDVCWRTHPDYRADVCFDYATRANFGGLSHSERVFLALSLLHRYKNSRSGSRFEQLGSLLSPAETQRAEILGKAMRFGAMFTAQKADDMGILRWSEATQTLTLSVGQTARALYGEVAEARFGSLAKALGGQTEVITLDTAQDARPRARSADQAESRMS